jgi:hypothetical protein
LSHSSKKLPDLSMVFITITMHGLLKNMATANSKLIDRILGNTRCPSFQRTGHDIAD